MNPPNEMDFSPVLLIEIDLADPLTDLDWERSRTGSPYTRAQVLVRIYAQPIGQVYFDSPLHSMDPEMISQRIWEGLRLEINHFLRENNLPEIDRLGTAGLSKLDLPGHLSTPAKQLGSAPLVSVVVTTHDRPESLEETLRSISRVDYPHFEVVIIDNAGFHSTKHIDVPDNIYLLNIPPYCPELNPCEKIWQHLKSRFKNKTFDTIKNLKQWLAESVKQLTREQVMSITHNKKYIDDFNAAFYG